MEKVRYAQKKMIDAGIEAKLNRNTITVTFPTPSRKLVSKWQLATQDDYAHILTVPGVTYEVIDSFIEDLSRLFH